MPELDGTPRRRLGGVVTQRDVIAYIVSVCSVPRAYNHAHLIEEPVLTMGVASQVVRAIGSGRCLARWKPIASLWTTRSEQRTHIGGKSAQQCGPAGRACPDCLVFFGAWQAIGRQYWATLGAPTRARL